MINFCSTSVYGTCVDLGQSGPPGPEGPPGPSGLSIIGGSISFEYIFSAITTNSEPDNGYLRLNNSVQNASTALYVSNIDNSSNNLTAILGALTISTNNSKARFRLFSESVQGAFITFTVSGQTAHVGYSEFAITNIGASSASPFSDTSVIAWTIDLVGDQGSTSDDGIVGGPISNSYNFSSDTSGANPGSGNLALNNSNQSLATILSVSTTDALSNNLAGLLGTLAISSNGVKGRFRIASVSNVANFIIANFSSLVTNSGYDQYAIDVIAASTSSPFTNSEPLFWFVDVTGDQGQTGANGQIGGAISMSYTFNSSTSNADPGSGQLALNNATQNAATALYVDTTDALGNNLANLLNTFASSTNSAKARFRLIKTSNASSYLFFTVTGMTTHSGYMEYAISNIIYSGSAPFSNGNPLYWFVDFIGNVGPSGSSGTVGQFGGPLSMSYNFSTSTVNADPGSGMLALNNATQNTATAMYVDTTDALGNNLASVLGTLGESSGPVKGQFRLIAANTPTVYLSMSMTALITHSGYNEYTIGVIGSSSSSPFTNGEAVQWFVDLIGSAGNAGATGTTGNAGGPITMSYTFNSSTTNADPGSGMLALNSSSQNVATAMYVDTTDALGNNLATLLSALTVSTNTAKARFRLIKVNTPASYLVFYLTGLTTHSGYDEFAIDGISASSSAPFSNGNSLTWFVDIVGSVGQTGSAGSNGALGGAVNMYYNFNSSTGGGNPGSGNIAFNSATQNTSTAMYVSTTDSKSNALATLMATFVSSTSVIPARFRIIEQSSAGSYLTFTVTAMATNSGYNTFTIANVASSSSNPFNNGDALQWMVDFTGNAGAAGTNGATGLIGGPMGFTYTFNTATSGAPGSGNLLFNSATQNAATSMNVSTTDAVGDILSSLFAALNISTSNYWARFRFTKLSDQTKFLYFQATGSTSSSSGYYTFPLSIIASSGTTPFSNGDSIGWFVDIIGDKGPAGTNGTAGTFGGPLSFSYLFNTSTSASDPGSGYLSLNSSTQNAATTLYVDLTDSLGNNVSGIMGALATSSNTTKANIRLVSQASSTAFLFFTMSALTTGSYNTYTISNVASSSNSPFTNGQAIYIFVDLIGNVGSAGTAINGMITMTSSGTFTPPSGVKQLYYMLTSAGGAGGSTPSAYSNAGSGGGGSGCMFRFWATTDTTDLPSYTIVIGTGGTPVASSNGNPGGNSTINPTPVVYSGTTTIYGGAGGHAPTSNSSAGLGAGGGAMNAPSGATGGANVGNLNGSAAGNGGAASSGVGNNGSAPAAYCWEIFVGSGGGSGSIGPNNLSGSGGGNLLWSGGSNATALIGCGGGGASSYYGQGGAGASSSSTTTTPTNTSYGAAGGGYCGGSGLGGSGIQGVFQAFWTF